MKLQGLQSQKRSYPIFSLYEVNQMNFFKYQSIHILGMKDFAL